MALTVTSFANGAYYPTAWGWTSVAFLWIVSMALIARSNVGLSVLESSTMLSLLALTAWMPASIAWSAARGVGIAEGQRALVFVSGLMACVVVARHTEVRHLLNGACLAIFIVCTYALGTRLFPERLGVFDPIASYRLSEPIGYWNALGIVAALGALLAIGLVARSRSWPGRALAAASLTVFLSTLYFTYSRGAWIALGLGLIAAVVLDPRRLQFVAATGAAAPWAALGVWLASRSSALTNLQSSLPEAAHEGHRLAAILLVLGLSASVSVAVFAFVSDRITVPRSAQLASGVALAAASAATATAIFISYGSPPTIVQKAYDSFTAPAPKITGDLNARLFTLSGNGRYQEWKTAWRMYKADPWLGRGSGSYEEYWTRHRPIAAKVKDAHSLYVETLAELGPIGLALLVMALGLPLAAGIKARRHPLVPAAFAAYVAYIVHAGVDWDWEMPAVTLTALLCGAAMLIVARGDHGRPIGPLLRGSLLAVVVALGALSFVGLIGNSALATAQDAAAKGDWTKSESQAQKAADWMPWSQLPWSALGEAQLQRGDRGAARRSFQKAIDKAPGIWTEWFNLARASSGRERSRALAEAARRNPLSPEVAALRRSP
jgi:O-Antigen ligase